MGDSQGIQSIPSGSSASCYVLWYWGKW